MKYVVRGVRSPCPGEDGWKLPALISDIERFLYLKKKTKSVASPKIIRVQADSIKILRQGYNLLP